MKSREKIALKIEVSKLRIALQGAKVKIFQYQQGKEEIDETLADALLWIERGLAQGVHDAPQN